MEHKGTKTIETGRLTLRPVREADVEAGCGNWCGDSLVTEFLMRPTHENSGVNRIEARHDPANPHSGDVMRKCGMTCDGTLRQAALSNRGVTDVCVYGILRSEWKDKKRSNL